mmetsp:Transcript_25151/g.68166  ORF Transcript_25151/g.68166 Transcript_25151/m.68166 type:complete len:232 (-) Transcript_25151:180-875(-)
MGASFAWCREGASFSWGASPSHTLSTCPLSVYTLPLRPHHERYLLPSHSRLDALSSSHPSWASPAVLRPRVGDWRARAWAARPSSSLAATGTRATRTRRTYWIRRAAPGVSCGLVRQRCHCLALGTLSRRSHEARAPEGGKEYVPPLFSSGGTAQVRSTTSSSWRLVLWMWRAGQTQKRRCPARGSTPKFTELRPLPGARTRRWPRPMGLASSSLAGSATGARTGAPSSSR